MKKILTIVLALFFLTASGARAENGGRNNEAKKTARTQMAVDRVQDKVGLEIDQRVEGMKKLIVKLTEMKKITIEQKTRLITQVQEQIDSLLKIKESLETETDLEKLKELRKSVVTSYRIFVVFIPRTNLLAFGDRLLNIADKMLSLTGVTDEAKAKISESKTKTIKAMDLALSVTPSNYPENSTTLKEAKSMMIEARKLLNEARVLLKNEK